MSAFHSQDLAFLMNISHRELAACGIERRRLETVPLFPNAEQVLFNYDVHTEFPLLYP